MQINFYDNDRVRPAKKGYYLVLSNRGCPHYNYIEYDTDVNKWNYYPGRDTTIKDVLAWADLPDEDEILRMLEGKQND